MDSVSRYGTLICFGLLLMWYFYMSEHQPPVVPAKPTVVSTLSPAPIATNAASSPGTPHEPTLNSSLPAPTPAPTAAAPEVLTSLDAPATHLTFTSQGGALKSVELLEQKNGEAHVLLNENGYHPLLGLKGWADGLSFTVKATTPNSITYAATLADGLQWERTYTITDKFIISLQDRLINPSTVDATLPDYVLSLGRSEPLHVGPHHAQLADQYLGTAFFTQWSFFSWTLGLQQITLNDFNAADFFWIYHSRDGRTEVTSQEKAPGEPIQWAAAQNQFFAQVLTPLNGLAIDKVSAFCYNPRDAYGNIPRDQDPDLETFAHFAAVKIPAGQTVALTYSLYAGPKDYDRLGKLGETQASLMNFGHFVFLIWPMLWLLRAYHGFLFWAFGTTWGWGWAIIMLTATVKLITWPVQSAAYRAGKRMQAIAPLVKEIQAKHKDNPEKLQAETWALYKDYGVNPLGGCWTALIQMPVFFSLYFMLQSAIDLRGASFLWAHDLSQTDTIYSFAYAAGKYIAINPLPILVTATMAVMMRLTPMTGADPTQQKVAQFMPLIFLFIFYNFASALSLYYVVNNCVSIFQVYRNLKKPLPVLTKVPKKKKAV